MGVRVPFRQGEPRMFINTWPGKKIQARTASQRPVGFLFVSDAMLPLATSARMVSERAAPLFLRASPEFGE